MAMHKAPFLTPRVVLNMGPCLPDIVIDDVAAPPSKRQRLNASLESACNASEYELLARATPIPSTCATAQEICENTLVCYGMVRRNFLSFAVYAYIV
jgi:hypothetical protein